MDAAGWAGAALEASLQARAPNVHASTPTVRHLAIRVARELDVDDPLEAVLQLAVSTRDIGMIALPDTVVLATARLSPSEWELVTRHPGIGAELLEQVTVVAAAAPIVRAHHERWDGSGYPDGHRGRAIPLLSRVISVCDAFVAIAMDRPYRRGIGADAALEHVHQGSGLQFDPDVVETLITTLTRRSSRPQRPSPAPRSGPLNAPGGARGPGTRRSALTAAIAALEQVPVFTPAYERLMQATASDDTPRGDIVATIETDIGLTLAVLRRAQTVPGTPPTTNVADAVAGLSLADLQESVTELPRAGFPWHASRLEDQLHRLRVHAQAVTRAADQISRRAQLPQRDDLIAPALLHDIGKLVLANAFANYTDADEAATTPEARTRQERRAFGMDHATLGGLLLRGWGLPHQLVTTTVLHHSAEAADEIATHVRLADMIVHHVRGDAVEQRTLLRLARECGLTATTLRDVMFDLPHTAGSQRRRAERSPLSQRQTEILRIMSEGKTYKDIAQELGISPSTARSHLHNSYQKLGVQDRAQAVLRASEMGWL